MSADSQGLSDKDLELLKKQYEELENIDFGKQAISKSDEEVEAAAITSLSYLPENENRATVDAINAHLVKSARLIKQLDQRKIGKDELERRINEMRKNDMLPLLRAIQDERKEKEELIKKFDKAILDLKKSNSQSTRHVLTADMVRKSLQEIHKGDTSTEGLLDETGNFLTFATSNLGIVRKSDITVNVSQDRIETHPLGPMTVVGTAIYEKLIEYGDIFGIIQSQDIGNAETWQYPFMGGFATMADGTERSDYVQTELPNFYLKDFTVHPKRWYVIVTEKMLRNWPGLPSWVINQAAKFMYVYMNYDLLHGDGVNKPLGMLRFIGEGKKVRRYGTGVSDGLFGNWFDYNKVAAEMKDYHFRRSVVMMNNQTWWNRMTTYVNANLDPYIKDYREYMLLGQKVIINPDMPSEGSGTSPIIIFNPENFYLRVYNNFQRLGTLKEKAFPHTAYFGESNVGGGILDAEAGLIIQCNTVKGILTESEVIP